MLSRSRVARTAYAVQICALAACAPGAAGSSPAPSPAPRDTSATASALSDLGPISVRVESHNSSDVVVYAARGRMRQRIGTVTGSTTRTLTIPVQFLTDRGGFYLVAHRVGGGAGTDVNSPTVTVQTGQMLVWTLESDLTQSELAVM